MRLRRRRSKRATDAKARRNDDEIVVMEHSVFTGRGDISNILMSTRLCIRYDKQPPTSPHVEFYKYETRCDEQLSVVFR